MKLHYLVLLGLLVASVHKAQGQNLGYIINQQGQKMYGKVKLLDQQQVRFQGDSGTQVYQVSQIKEIGAEQGKIYQPRKGSGTDTLLKFRRLLVSGPTALYQDGGRFLLVKQGSDSALVLEEIKTVTKEYQKVKKQYIGAFTYAMMDCPSIQPQIASTRFELKALSRLVHAYNLCSHPTSLSAMHIQAEGVHWEWGLNVQGAMTNAAFVGDRLSESYASLKFSQGFGYAAGGHVQANIRSGWSVRMGLLYASRPHEASGKTEFYSTRATLNNQWVELPVAAIRYFRRNQNGWKPFLSGGVLMAFGNHGQNTRTTTQLNGAFVTDDLNFGKFAFGLNLGTGIRIPLRNGHQMDVEYQYQQVAAKSSTSARFYAHAVTVRWAKPMKSSR